MKHYAIWISYDGGQYSGWQRQNNSKSVQQVIEQALKTLLKESITIHASGRTDAGVHATGQCASFQATTPMTVDKFLFALNNRMPSDIAITALKEVPESFHARYSATGKTYVYQLYTGRESNPFLNRYYAQVKKPMNEEAVRHAMTAFLGEHDFVGFMASGSQVKDTVRTITDFKLNVVDNLWTFEITGDGFLYNMVRIIIGLLIRVGHGDTKSDEIEAIIHSRNRDRARWTAPPQGLLLKKVFYPQNAFKIEDNS